jgi:hypothetical protein
VTTVPLVIYDNEGNRKVIGSAEVEKSGSSFVIAGTVTDPSYIDAISVNNPDWYSVCTMDDDIQEAAIVPPMVVPKPHYQNVFDKKEE